MSQSVKQLGKGWMVQRSNTAEGEIFYTHLDWPWGSPSLLYNRYHSSLPGLKQLGCGIDHPPPSSAKVKERLELYVFYPSGSSWTILGRTLLINSLLLTHILYVLSTKSVHRFLSFVFTEQVHIFTYISCDYLPRSHVQIIITLQQYCHHKLVILQCKFQTVKFLKNCFINHVHSNPNTVALFVYCSLWQYIKGGSKMKYGTVGNFSWLKTKWWLCPTIPTHPSLLLATVFCSHR
jgi:hypothetical protein